MIRNLKALGLALVAVFAMSALVASAAQATPELTAFNTSTSTHEHATLFGSQIGKHKFTTAAGAVECEVATFQGTIAAGTASTLTIAPTFQRCNLGGTFVIHITMNGCDYLLHMTEKIGTDHYKAHTDIVCSTGEIDWTITNLLGTKSICTLQIPGQTGLTTVEIRNNTAASPADIELEFAEAEIEYTSTAISGAGCGGLANGVHNGVNGATYTGNTTIQAENTAKELVDLEAVGS